MWPRSEVGISKITDTLHFAYQHGCFCGFSRHTDNKKNAGHSTGIENKKQRLQKWVGNKSGDVQLEDRDENGRKY